MNPSALFTIGRVTGVHGVKGYVKAVSFAESLSIFKPGLKLLFKNVEGSDSWLEIERVSAYKKGMLNLFRNADRAFAEQLCGHEFTIRRKDLPEPDPDAYYWNDLIGLEVADENRGVLGTIDSVMATGSNDVFVVKGEQGETLVPALAWVVKEIDLEGRFMTVDLPEGL